jgi:hypothetical protein
MMPHCAHLRYVVERLSGQCAQGWTVEFFGEHVGRYRRRREALTAAFFDAKRVGDLGNDTEVWVRRSDGTIGATWHYDRLHRRMERDGPSVSVH